MIQSKSDYLECLKADARALGFRELSPFWRMIRRITDPIYQFERALRFDEYCRNCLHSVWVYPLKLFAAWNHRRLGLKCGFTIPVNTFGKGLSIAHTGTIIVNSYARIGDYCRIHACTNIGAKSGRNEESPVIGNGVFIGPGAKIFGKIVIADDIAVGANAVVNKSFPTPGVSIAGVPARVVSTKNPYQAVRSTGENDLAD